MTSAAFSSDGKSIVSATDGSTDDTVRVWNASTGEQVRVYKDAEAVEHKAEASAQHRSIAGNASVRSVDKCIVLTENALAASSSVGTESDGESSDIIASYSSDRFALQGMRVLRRHAAT